MTKETLIDLSGIKEEKDFQTFDYAVPINRDGSYPYGGNAIAVYRKGRCFCEIVSCKKLAEMAIAKGEKSEQLKELVE